MVASEAQSAALDVDAAKDGCRSFCQRLARGETSRVVRSYLPSTERASGVGRLQDAPHVRLAELVLTFGQ